MTKLNLAATQRVSHTEIKRYWLGDVGPNDDFGEPIGNSFVDGATLRGPWAIMSKKSWMVHSVKKLGTGYGQRYEKQKDGRWLKVEG